ncbi:MAG: phosphoribosylglycinamide formyltransferase-1 [Candidatus Azotimanducaceae bacterium]|jgi:phosphoribosylglycinamide formyltransferase-1
MKKLGILASHRGTNFQAIIDASKSGDLKATPVIAISNNSDSEALTRAMRADIATAHLSSVTHPDPNALDEAILKSLEQHAVDIVVTVGYMKKLGPQTLATFKGNIYNIHPSLLPKYGGKGMFGLNVHKAVIEAGDSETGVTVHRLEDEYDTGPIVAQQRVPVMRGDSAETLSSRIIKVEHLFLIETLNSIINHS